MSPSLGFSDVFLMGEGPFSSYRAGIHDTRDPHDGDLIAWMRWWLPGFSTIKLLFSPFPTLFFESEPLSITHLGVWEFSSSSWKGAVPTNTI